MNWKYLAFLAVSLIGIWFLTKSWIPTGFAVVGHDSGLAVNASEFLKSRLFAWDPQGFGRDNSAHFGSLTIHFVDFLSSKLSQVPYGGNQLNLFFWISAIFISACIFSYQLKEVLGKYFPFLFPVFVTFNFYILQSIFIIERAKYSLFIDTLLFLTIVIKLHEKKISALAGGLILSLILFFFNSGSWLGLPLYGGLIVLSISVFAFELVSSAVKKDFKPVFQLLIFYLVTGVGFVILNAYSILPYVATFFAQDYYAVTSQNIISQNLGWLNAISQASSYLNIFRLQGVPDWYAGSSQINIDHAYASLYSGNIILVLISYIFPVLIILPFILARSKEQRWTISLFGVILFLGLFFMAGSHPPLGFIYAFLYQHIPGFSIFRSPYYKFGSIFFIAASLLMSFTLSYFIDRYLKPLKDKYKSWVGFLLSMGLIVLWFSFYSPALSPGKIFTWQPGYSTKVKVPSYVFDFATWFNSQKTADSRTLLVPSLNKSWGNDAYSWGYWSLTNLPSVVSNKPFVTNGGLEGGQGVWVDRLYTLIKNKDEQGVFDLSKRLGIDYFLLRKDVLSDSSWSAVLSPTQDELTLESFRSLKRVKSFNEWVLYKFDRDLSSKFTATNGLVAINKVDSYLTQEFYSHENTVFTDDKAEFNGYLSKDVSVYTCQSCLLEEKDSLASLPQINIWPNSPFYYFKLKKEEETLKNSKTDRSKIDAYLGLSLRRASEIIAMWDMGIDSKYSVDSLVKINKYLNEVYKVFSDTSKTDQSFFEAKRLNDNVNIVERSFKNIVSTQDFGRKNSVFRQEMLNVLWSINELKSLFPIINDISKLETEKVYLLSSLGQKNSSFYIDISTLPTGLDSQPILPMNVTFTSNGNEINIPVSKVDLGLLKLDIPKNFDSGRLTLKFNKFPNLLKIEGTSLEQSPLGSRRCLVGSISQFNQNRLYRIEINATKKDQALRMFLRDREIKSGESNFIQGQDESDIFPTLSYQPFYHIYYPSGGTTGLQVFLCNSNKEIPVVDGFEFHEIVSPRVIFVDEITQSNQNYPKINYEKLSLTHYKIKIEGASEQFILIFNEAYNSSWKLDEENAQHFIINGYANAWKISRTGSYTLNLTYLPQEKFRKGFGVTVVSLICFLATLVFLFIKNRKNHERKN